MKTLTSDRARFALTVVCAVIFAFTVALFQTSAAHRVFRTAPDLILAAAAAYAIRNRDSRAVFFALLCSFLADASGSVGFSLMPLYHVAAALVFSYIGSNAKNDRRFVAFWIFFPAAALSRSLLTLFSYAVKSSFSLDLYKLFVNVLFPEFIYTLIAAIPLYFAAMLFSLPSANERKEG